ncbi:MAG TPA: NADH-quinone oxidoreductase subunit G [Streptosporangiaceae bacterium]
MTVQATSGPGAPAPVETVTVTIDSFEIAVPKGTLVIRAAELLGIQIPRFCDHPLLDPIGACRQCLVDVEGQRKPLASCTTVCTDGMVVRTQLTSPVAEKAQRGVMELLLVNHPLDCPMCDKGGECPLQNQAMTNGQGETRFTDEKRTFDKPVPISSEVLLDRERCISCTRCTRFSEEIAGDPFIEFVERGPSQMIGTAAGEPFNSYFSGNTVQICPVGALTGAPYRFRARPFDLVSTPSVCEHCASGCRQRTDHRRGRVMRRLAADDPQVNEEWNCDKGRWASTYATEPDRLTAPLVRNADGVLVPASWPEAIRVAAQGLLGARGGPLLADREPVSDPLEGEARALPAAGPRGAAVLTGGRLTLEDSYAYAKFARVALGTNDIDMRARPHSAEEAGFISARVAGQGIQVSYDDLEHAPAVLLAGLEPEEESPIVLLRLRKAVRRNRASVFALAPFASRGLVKTTGVLLPTAPGDEARALTRLAEPASGEGSTRSRSAAAGSDDDQVGRDAARALAAPDAIILVGERLAETPGALSAAVQLAETTGARLAWIPRRAGERGAIEAGAMPNLLPVGRPVSDADARAEVARVWGVGSLPATPGRDTAAILAAAAAGELGALLVAGVDPADLPDPAAALAALDATPFVVSLEIRVSAVTDRADVVLPVAAVPEKAGTFVNWEGRGGTFTEVLPVPGIRTELYVLGEIADEMDVHLGLPHPESARAEIARIGTWRGGRETMPVVPAQVQMAPEAGQAVLATWSLLLDRGRMQDGEPYLAGTASMACARMSAGTAAEAAVSDGDKVTVATERGALTLPVEVTDMPDRVVWLPANSAGCAVRAELAAGNGTRVTLRSPE